MRIICTVTNDLSTDQRMSRICQTLQAGGHQVTLVGRELPDSKPLPERSYRQFRIRCRNLSGKRFYAEYNWRLWRELREWSFDVICAVDLDTLLAGWWLTRKGSRRLVYDAHEWFSETPEVYLRPVIRSFWRRLGQFLVPRTDARYTVAPKLAEQLALDYRRPFGVIRNLPESKLVSFSEKEEGVIIYQGMLNPGRGLAEAIGALPSLPDLKLWIIGDGSEMPALRALAERWNVTDRVWFAGLRPPSELPELTSRAWLGLNLLSAGSPSYYYSLANKSLDYIQARLPSLQMDFPEYKAIHEEYGCFELIGQLNGPVIAAHVAALYHEPARYAALQEGCRVAAEELCWEREAPRLLEIYAGLERS